MMRVWLKKNSWAGCAVEPPKKHRVIAITDVVYKMYLQEVDDIRISDDSGRTDGKLTRT